MKLRVSITIAVMLLCISFYPGCRQQTAPGENGDNNGGGENGGKGRTFYVSTTGNDSNPGTGEQPWASPGFASRQLAAGDTLVIRAGTYILSEYDDDILIPPSGKEGAPITITGEENERPILAGKSNLDRALTLSSYLVVRNLEITSRQGAQFRDAIQQIDDPITQVTLENLYIHHIDEFGINIADVDHLVIKDCRILYTAFGSIGGPEGQDGGWRNVVIENCDLSYNGHYYQGGPGPGPYDRPDGFGIEASPGPIEIKYTLASHNRGDGLDSKAGDTYIHHCIVANNSCDGIKLWAGSSRIENCLVYGTGDGIGGASPWAGIVIEPIDDGYEFEIFNISLHDNPTRRAYPMYFGYDQQADFQVTVKNCIVSNGYGPAYFGPRVNPIIEYNIFFRPGALEQVEANGRTYTVADITAGLLGTGNISVDPLFVAPAWGSAGDYRLQAGSPGIDAGTAAGAPVTDLEGTPRPQGQGVDIGAYEKKD